jgi:phosphoglycerate dehydrogenase-like enzyme
MNHLLIFDNDAPAYRTELENRNLPGLSIASTTDLDEARSCAPEVEIIFGQPALVAEILPEARRLRWVQSTFAGIEPLCRPTLRTDYRLTGVKDIFGALMREYVIGYIILRERSFLQMHRNQQNRTWQRIAYRGLAEVTIGVIGLGSIGRSIARAARGFGMTVLGMKRTAEEVEGVDHLYLPEQVEAFLPQLDYLVTILPDTPGSRHFITRKELQMMKSSAVLINVGRGVTVKQDDLVAALQNNEIGGAILDVFENEPLPEESPLWGMDNVIVTPHNSAYSFPAQVAGIFAENYRLFIEERPLRYLIDFNRGY